MSRSTLLRSISSRTAATSATPVANRSFRPFVIPRLRHASTSNTAANSRTTSLPVLLGALTCAFLGYTVGSSAGFPSQVASSLGLGRRQVPAENDEPTYGTPEDFQQAIRELRHTFSNEAYEPGVVSTDPDDLRIHGFSQNDHHLGACHSSLSVSTSIVLPPHLRPRIAINYPYAPVGLYRCSSYSSSVPKKYR